MGYNVNTVSISRYLWELSEHAADSELRHKQLYMLLCCALRRPLARELANQSTPVNLFRQKKFSADSPDWVRAAILKGEHVYDFSPQPQLGARIDHVLDWLDAATANNEPWLAHTDQLGRPLKLLKLGSVDQAVAEADKAMLRHASAHVEAYGPGHLATVKTFPDGAHIVQLMTPRALDAESHAMGHCIGQGAYDHKLEAATHAYYSLRSASGKSRATMELREDNALLQCQGKQNTAPAAKYMPYIKEFVQEREFDISDCPQIGLIKQDGRYFDVTALPEDFRYDGDLDLSAKGVRKLPEGFTVTGSLRLCATGIQALPPRFSVGKHLDLRYSDIQTLPENLRVPGTLYLYSTPLKTLPANLRAGTLDLEVCDIEHLPPGLTIDRDLSLYSSSIRALPPGLHVPGDLDLRCSRVRQIPPDIKIGRSLFIDRAQAELLPGNLHLPGTLHISDADRTRLPQGLRIGDTLHIYRSAMVALPPDIHIGKNLELRQCDLDTLPEALRLPGHLDISGTYIAKLPKSMTIGGHVFVDGNTRLPELPPYFSGKLMRDGTRAPARPDMVLSGSYGRARTPRALRPTPEAEIEF